MPGPRAVRSMRAPREELSVWNGVTVMMGPAMVHGTDLEDRQSITGNGRDGVVA